MDYQRLNNAVGAASQVKLLLQLSNSKRPTFMGLCASSATDEKHFTASFVENCASYQVQTINMRHKKLRTNIASLSLGLKLFHYKLIKRMESPAQSLKLCKFNGQGDRKVALKLYHRDTLEENTVLLEKIVDSSEAAVSIEHLYITRLFHSFRSPSSRVWYLCTAPFLVDLVHYISLNQLYG